MQISFFTLTGISLLHAAGTPPDGADYSRLLAFVKMQDMQDPLVAFGAAENDFDRDLNRENIAFLNNDKTVLGRIQSKLKGEKLNWQLSHSSKQLMAVPENRDEYARLFEQYCRTAVNYLLERIHAATPYERIVGITGTGIKLCISLQMRCKSLYSIR
jgi:hypothetical protein